MRDRLTARVLLFDPAGRVLMMKGRPPATPDAPGVWFTVGGGVKAGESLVEAARREILEETGFSDFELGAVVWYREAVLANAAGEPRLFKESYILARCDGGEPSRDGWQALERSLVEEIRWWSAEEVRAATDEVFYPEGFADLLAEVAWDRVPDAPKVLSLIDAP